MTDYGNMRIKGKRSSGKNTGTIYEVGIENGENYTRGYMITKDTEREVAKVRQG